MPILRIMEGEKRHIQIDPDCERNGPKEANKRKITSFHRIRRNKTMDSEWDSVFLSGFIEFSARNIVISSMTQRNQILQCQIYRLEREKVKCQVLGKQLNKRIALTCWPVNFIDTQNQCRESARIAGRRNCAAHFGECLTSSLSLISDARVKILEAN